MLIHDEKNDKAGEPVVDPVAVARGRLLGIMRQVPMDPMQTGFAAYINGVLQSARVDALVDLYLHPPNATWTADEALQAAFIKAMNNISDALEANNRKIQVAGSVGAPGIHLNGSS